VETRYAQIVRELAAQVRSVMEKKPLPGLTPEEAAAIAVRLRARSAEQREFFAQLVEDALSKIRTGDDVAFVQLRLLRDKLDPVSKMRFDEVLRRYGLAEVKHKTPEYSLREEDAPALERLFRRDKQRAPEYTLREEDALAVDRIFRRDLQRTPEYSLREEDAAALARIFKRDKQRMPEYALTDEAAVLLDQFLKMEPRHVLTGRAVAELAERKAKRRLSKEKATVKPQHVLTSKIAAELASRARLKPVLTGRTALELQTPKQEPKLTGRAELELPAVRSALEYALKPRAETITETALTPELRQTLAWAQEVGRKLITLSELVKPPRALQLLKEEPTLKERRRRVVPILPALQIEPPQGTRPWIRTPEMPERISQYEPMLVPTSITPPMTYVPPMPTYTPLGVPRLTTYDIPTVPTPDVPTYDRYTRRLPYGWWLHLPPHIFFADRAGEGAYKVQEGKKQILALA
ncbi:MAG: hypothetical protein ACO2PN_24285, partial [Pyrobaculum sp.]|jgi:hypothetical protein